MCPEGVWGPKAGRRTDFGSFLLAARPKSGPEGRFVAQKHYCVRGRSTSTLQLGIKRYPEFGDIVMKLMGETRRASASEPPGLSRAGVGQCSRTRRFLWP